MLTPSRRERRPSEKVRESLNDEDSSRSAKRPVTLAWWDTRSLERKPHRSVNVDSIGFVDIVHGRLNSGDHSSIELLKNDIRIALALKAEENQSTFKKFGKGERLELRIIYKHA